MSVSSGNGNDELIMAIKGGVTFDERLNQMAASTASLNKAYEDLNLGKSAVDAFAFAKALEAEAKSKFDAAVQSSLDMIAKANEDADGIYKKARAASERDRKAIDDERAALYEMRDAAVAEIEAKHAVVGSLAREAAANRREATNELFEAQELKNGLLRDQDTYKCELNALRNLRDRASALVVELHYVEVSPQKVPPVAAPEVPPVLEPVKPVGMSMGGVEDAAVGQSMGGVDDVVT